MKMHSSFYIKSCPFMKDFCKAIFYFWGFTLNYKAEVDWAKFESKNTLKALEIFEHDLTFRINILFCFILIESPYQEVLSDSGWLNIIKAFPLQKNLKQGLVSHADLFDYPVPPPDIPADDPNCAFRVDTKVLSILKILCKVKRS